MKPVPLLFRPPIFALALIILSIILHFTYPVGKIINYPINLLGIVGLVIGLYIALKGKNTFQKLGAPVIPGKKPKIIVREGLFKFTRNPMYLGFIIFLLGIAVLLGSIVALISPMVFFLIINFIFIPFEERLMERTFGKKYLEYKKQVRKWV